MSAISDALAVVQEIESKSRRVATPEGAARYGVPIGTLLGGTRASSERGPASMAKRPAKKAPARRASSTLMGSKPVADAWAAAQKLKTRNATQLQERYARLQTRAKKAEGNAEETRNVRAALKIWVEDVNGAAAFQSRARKKAGMKKAVQKSAMKRVSNRTRSVVSSTRAEAHDKVLAELEDVVGRLNAAKKAKNSDPTLVAHLRQESIAIAAELAAFGGQGKRAAKRTR